MTMFDRITIALIAATAVAWIVWDVILGAKRQKTESMWIAEWSRQWNVLPFLLGALIGHWTLQTPAPNYALWPFAVAAAVAVLAYDLLCHPWSAKGSTVTLLRPARWMRYPGLWTLFGVAMGSLLWGQRLP